MAGIGLAGRQRVPTEGDVPRRIVAGIGPSDRVFRWLARAEPGDHSGGIVASVATPGTTADGKLVTVDRRIAARVYLRVDGPLLPSVRVEAVSVAYDNPLLPFGGGPAMVRYRVANTGNVRVAGSADVRVTGPFGWRLGGANDVELPELLPGARAEFTREVKGVFPAGRLSAEVALETSTVDDVALPGVRRSAGTWALPWLLVGIVVLGGAAVGVRQWLRARRRGLDREFVDLAPSRA